MVGGLDKPVKNIHEEFFWFNKNLPTIPAQIPAQINAERAEKQQNASNNNTYSLWHFSV
jgi:hypothetical protein